MATKKEENEKTEVKSGNDAERLDMNNVKPAVTTGAISLVLFTFYFLSYPFVALGMWMLAAGIAAGLVLFSFYPVMPCLLLNYKPRRKNCFQEDLRLQSPGKCTICGNSSCQRHRPEVSRITIQPWEGLLIPENVDTALDEFLSLLIEKNIYSWYRELSCNERCIDELRTSLRYMASVMLRRVKMIDLPTLISEKFGKVALQHLDLYINTRGKVTLSSTEGQDVQTSVLECLGPHMHCSLQSRVVELQYLRKVSESIFPFLLPPNSLHCRSLLSLLRELLSGVVLLPAMDKLSDPDFVNSLLLLFLDENPMVASREPPSPKVHILSNFSQLRSPKKNSALHLSVADILHSQKALFPFMQFMKSEAALNVLQFCLTVEDFNKRVFASEEVIGQEELSLAKEAKEIYSMYFDTNAVDRIHFQPDIVDGLKTVISKPLDKMQRLKMASLMSKAYEHAYNLLECTFLPLFYQSDDYFSLLCGSRLPAKPLSKPTQRASKKKFDPLAEFSKLAGKLKDKVLNPSRDEVPFEEDPFDPAHTPADFELESEEEDMDDAEEDETLRDLSLLTLTVPNMIMQTKQKCLYIISVERNDLAKADHWDVARSYKEFYVLHSKLKEFHGSIEDTFLPPKRSSSMSLSQKKLSAYFETCQEQFELYLQSLVNNPLLRGSALLFNFLSPEKECKEMFGSDTVGDIAGKKFKSMTTILKKERGQNVEPFLASFMSSTFEPTKRKPLPRNMLDTGARGYPMAKEDRFYHKRKRSSGGRLKLEDISNVPTKPELKLNGITDYILFLLEHLFKLQTWLMSILSCSKVLVQQTLDAFAEQYLAGKLELLKDEQRLVMIIHLLRDAIFFDQDPPRTDSQKLERREESLKELLAFLPDPAVRVIGGDRHKAGITLLFELLQHRKLNKQLAYVLLDTLLMELFPELAKEEEPPVMS